MTSRLSRRAFLERGAVGSLTLFSPIISVESIWAEAATAPAAVLTEAQRKTLTLAADEIIPAGPAGPGGPAAPGALSASQAGAIDYIETLLGKLPELEKQVIASLSRIDALALKASKRSFAELPSPRRIATLQAFEKEAAAKSAGETLYSAGNNLFAVLRDLVYEAYYTSPKVWPQIGYEFHQTNRKGPSMEPFNEAILAKMKTREKNYREVKS